MDNGLRWALPLICYSAMDDLELGLVVEVSMFLWSSTWITFYEMILKPFISWKNVVYTIYNNYFF